MKTSEQIIQIIRRHQEECEEAAARYDDLAEEWLRRLPRETVQRKQYAIAAQVELLQTILDEIEPAQEAEQEHRSPTIAEQDTTHYIW